MKWFKSIKKERKRKQFEQVAKPSLKRKEGNIEYLYLNLFKTRNFIQIRRKKYIGERVIYSILLNKETKTHYLKNRENKGKAHQVLGNSFYP